MRGLWRLRLRRLRSFLRLPGVKQGLLLKATLLLGIIRLGLWLLPFETLRRLLIGFSGTPARLRDTNQPSLGEVTWAVETAGRCLPGAVTCLTLALTAQVLLVRRGYGAVIHIGIAKEGGERFQAHAWVESEGKVVIGDYEIDRYTPLASLEGKEVGSRLKRRSNLSRIRYR
jgi:hypothetical protein